MKTITDSQIEFIKQSANIMEIVGDFVKLKKKGSQYVGKSPFTNERTPSFFVHPSKGIFKDFSTGKGGDVIEFLMQHLSFSYIDSIRFIAKKYKIELNDNFVYSAPIRQPEPELPVSYVDPKEVEPTWYNYEANPLFQFLANRFGSEQVNRTFLSYGVGLYRKITDWVIFWQIDTKGMVRSGKYIKYGLNGKRSKDQMPAWHHKINKGDFNLCQCFFGEHLITGDIRKPLAIVESEKTALIASIMLPQYFWLASGSKTGLGEKKCEILQGRSVTLFPDLDAYTEWKDIAKIRGFSVSESIQKKATQEDINNKLDLADFLLR